MHSVFLQTLGDLVGLASALPTSPTTLNTSTITTQPSPCLYEAAANANAFDQLVPRRNPTAPQDRLIIDQMKTDGLPKYYFDCMVENRKWLMADIYSDNLHSFCDNPGFYDTEHWIFLHVQFCTADKCGDDLGEAAEASGGWMKKTCDRIPG